MKPFLGFFLCHNINETLIYFYVQIESLSVTFHGHDLIVDSELELNYGRLVIIFSSYSDLLIMAGNLIVTLLFQTLWFAGAEWLWEIYTSHCYRSS